MDNECSVVDYTSGDPVQCKKGAVRFGYCWEHMPQWYKDVLRLTPLALDAAMPPSAEPLSGLESVPAVESDTQPRK